MTSINTNPVTPNIIAFITISLDKKINNITNMDPQNEWVWYENKIALVMSHEPMTGFCEIQVLEKHDGASGGITTWEVEAGPIISNMAELRPVVEHEIEEIREGIFILDEGDTTYEPSSEDSASETDLEEEDYNLE
jgi:hypothetical protein